MQLVSSGEAQHPEQSQPRRVEKSVHFIGWKAPQVAPAHDFAHAPSPGCAGGGGLGEYGSGGGGGGLSTGSQHEPQ